MDHSVHSRGSADGRDTRGSRRAAELLVPLSDGSIVFLSSLGDVTGTLVGPPAPGDYAAVQPTWSPDGMRVAFSQGGIVVADLGGALHRLTSSASGGMDVGPSWSSDGRRSHSAGTAGTGHPRNRRRPRRRRRDQEPQDRRR